METNDQGQVAIRYRMTTPHNVFIGETRYPFIVRFNICMSWINPEHVETIKKMKHKSCHCGSGNSHPQYMEANEEVVRRWTIGGR